MHVGMDREWHIPEAITKPLDEFGKADGGPEMNT
jgi:hypothetical protein